MIRYIPQVPTSAAAGVAVALAATSLTSVLAGPHWWGLVVLTSAVVVAAGELVRYLRMPPTVAAAGQLVALLGLVTAVFTSDGWLVVLPGPAAAAQLRALLAGAAQQIRLDLPPVPESPELLCLVVVAIGLATIAVHILAISAAAPAWSGLVLLCVVSVPIAVSDRLLPWWSFALSAGGFALLLAVDSRRRQLAWGELTGAGRRLGATPVAVAATAGAIAVALLLGVTVTAVGTGRSSTARGAGRPANGIGLTPFTALRGQLSVGDAVALFRVRGLRQRTYLRALTLSRFTARVGWQPGPLDSLIPANGETTERLPLPTGVTTPVSGPTLHVQIEPLNYVDTWLPSYGYPLALGGIGPDWRYDPEAITIFSDHRQRAQPYTELGVLPTPDPQLLRAAGPASSKAFTTVDARYLDTGQADHRVAQLAAQVTAGTRTAFDATVALNRWFTQSGNGFRYDVRTALGNSGDDLVDFLFTGRRGYCEQFASAMAIMLRTLHVPARVAVGFTSGTVTDGSQLITTDDAHAWVEAWFPGAGWLPFDPTPLTDGRTAMPSYLAAGATPASNGPPLVAGSRAPVPDVLGGPAPRPSAGVDADPGANVDADPGAGTRIGLSVAGLLVLGMLAGITPLGIRESGRRRRLRQVSVDGPQAVTAAWTEVLAESADRGVGPCIGETVRATAQRLTDAYALDEPGRAALGILVDAVERSWYAGGGRPQLAPTGLGDNRTREPDRELRAAVETVRASLARCAPLPRIARLLPRSVLPTPKIRSRS